MASSSHPRSKVLRSGIGGIEKSLAQRAQITDGEISLAFKDLDGLMDRAKPMVKLAQAVAAKLKDKEKGGILDDETVQMKSYLLSLGVSDPVTRDSHGTGASYFKELAKELNKVLNKPIEDCGGMMTVTDAFCRVNRARGMELLSPDDLIRAIKVSKELGLPLQLKSFPSGLSVLHLSSADSESAAMEAVRRQLEDAYGTGGLTAEKLSRKRNISVVLAREQLLAAENKGIACRDDTVQGISFYPNLLLTQQ